MTTEIKLIQNKEENYFRVTVNGKDVYTPFTYGEDPDEETDARRTAKAAAFDETIRTTGNKKITYIITN